MNYPLKKRRGRPPKYLSVWQYQHGNNTITGDNNNNTITAHNNTITAHNNTITAHNNTIMGYNNGTVDHVFDVIDHVVDMSKGSNGISSEEHANTTYCNNNNSSNDNTNSNNSNDDDNNNNRNSNKDDNIGDVDNNQNLPSPHHPNLCSGSPPTDSGDSRPETQQKDGEMNRNPTTPGEHSPHPRSRTPDGGQTGRNSVYLDHNQDPAMGNPDRKRQNSTDRSNNGERFHIFGIAPSGSNGVGEAGVTSFRAESGQPIKRRPGRPPGSTKKARTSFPPFAKKSADEDQFSLRRFFEAGGRDYHEYLEWLKTKRNPTSSSPHVPLIMPPFCQLPMVSNDVSMTSQPFAFPAPPLYRTPIPLLTGVRTAATAVVAPVTPHEQTTDHERAKMAVQSTRNPNFLIQQTPFDYKCFTCKPNIPISDTVRQPAPDACILDLSSKRMRNDSDSEKENDCLDMSVNKRSRQDRGHFARRELVPKIQTGVDVRKPEAGSKQVTDDLVESSTGCDVTTTWSVEEVANFVSRIPECHVYAEVFRTQRIDGTTLPHLSDDHLLNHVGMKLGHMIHLRLALSRLKSENDHVINAEEKKRTIL